MLEQGDHIGEYAVASRARQSIGQKGRFGGKAWLRNLQGRKLHPGSSGDGDAARRNCSTMGSAYRRA